MRPIDTSKLSYAYIDAQPIDIDWEAARGENLDGLTVHLPAITAEVLAEYGREPDAFDQDDWLEDNLMSYISTDERERFEKVSGSFEDEDALDDWIKANWREWLHRETIAEIEDAMRDAKEEHDEEALEEAIERFEHSDGWYEWQDSFQPMMNALWPCEPRYELTDEDAATAIDKYAGATVLVTINSDQHNGLQGIALTGGGMDMSWDLCAAYICCGCIPPVRLLTGVPHFAGMKSSELSRAVLECMDLAADWLEGRAQRLREDRARLDQHLNK